MSRLMICSDLHLGHSNIHKYRSQYDTAEEHHEDIFERVATGIKKRDTLYLLGDVAFTKEWLQKIKLIQCRYKLLICGNHDTERGICMKDLVEVYDDVKALHSKRNYWFTHAPIHPQEMRGKLGVIHGHCITDDTEILTKDGWKGSDKIKKGDHVYSMDNSTLELVDDVVLNLFSKSYSGRMVSLKGQGVDIRVTDKHRIPKLTKKGISYILADEMKGIYKFKLIKSGEYKSKGLDLEDNLIKLYILLAADGSITPAKLCRVSVCKERKILKVKQLLEDMNLDFRVFGEGKDYTCYHFKLPKELENYNIKGLDKKITKCNRKQALLIKETYSWTDGNKNLIFTSKGSEVDILQHLFVVNGFSCKVHSRIGHGFSKGISYQLSVSDKTTHYMSKISSRVQEEYVDNEKVWCISNNNTNFICRRNGAVILTGNCHSFKVLDGDTEDIRYYNACLEHTNYAPISFEDLMERKPLCNAN